MVSPSIDTATLQSISDALAGLRPDVCSVQAPPTGRDAGGAPNTTYTTTASFDCRVDAANRLATERVFGPRIAAESDYTVALPRAALGTVDPKGRIVVERGAGQTLEIISVGDRDSHVAEVMIACKETR